MRIDACKADILLGLTTICFASPSPTLLDLKLETMNNQLSIGQRAERRGRGAVTARAAGVPVARRRSAGGRRLHVSTPSRREGPLGERVDPPRWGSEQERQERQERR